MASCQVLISCKQFIWFQKPNGILKTHVLHTRTLLCHCRHSLCSPVYCCHRYTVHNLMQSCLLLSSLYCTQS